jgi:hypothetical protein
MKLQTYNGDEFILSPKQLVELYADAKRHHKRIEENAIQNITRDYLIDIKNQYGKVVQELMCLHDTLPVTIRQNPDNDVLKVMRKLDRFIKKLEKYGK